jgi:hypothetical protein
MNIDKKPFSKRHWYAIVFLMVVLALIAIFGRDNETQPPEPPESEYTTASADLYPEFAAMYEADGTMGTWHTMSLSGTQAGNTTQPRSIDYVRANGYAVYEGDILLNLNRPVQAGLGIVPDSYLWTEGIVPYEIAQNLPDKQRVYDAIDHWESRTDIRFVPRAEANVSHNNYIEFRPYIGCASYVGMQNTGVQPILLARACSTGNTIHEIGHALGLWHEHSRSDRDDYVNVRYENIQPAAVHNFNKQIEDGRDIGAYDYGSIMHYPRWAFSKNGNDTIVPHDNQAIGQRDELSNDDISAIQEMYADEFTQRQAADSGFSNAGYEDMHIYGMSGCGG